MKALFLSDLHLGAGYIQHPAAHERIIVDFLNKEGSTATHIYLLGDVLDYWFEYRNVVPRGFVRFFGALARLADSGVRIMWMTGNHDIWLFDYLRDELGIEVVDAPYIERELAGKHFILSHGDRIGHTDFGFRFICSFFRNKFCQKLYSGIHPRLTIPFAHNWSKHSRAKNSQISEEMIQSIAETADEIAAQHPRTDFIIEGHHHIMLDRKLPVSNARLIVLGDWIDKFSYAVFDGNDMELKKYHA